MNVRNIYIFTNGDINFTENCSVKINIFEKSLWDEFLSDFKKFGTKIFRKGSSFQKKIFKKYLGQLKDPKWKKR